LPDKAEALGVLLVLLPGFASAYIVQFLAVRRRQTELDKVVEALLFSLILYVMTLPFFGNTLPIGWQLDPHRTDTYQVLVDWKHLAALAGLGILFALLYAANINRDWLMIAFRWMGVTERTARSTIWNDVFQETGGFVQVGISDGRSVMGWLRYYSDEASEPSLFLENAAWVVDNRDGTKAEIAIEGPGIFLTKETGIEYVIFLGWQKQETDDSTAVTTADK
jgi:hypothetical protein